MSALVKVTMLAVPAILDIKHKVVSDAVFKTTFGQWHFHANKAKTEMRPALV